MISLRRLVVLLSCSKISITIAVVTHDVSNYVPMAADLKCPFDETRIFKLSGPLEECYERCYNQPSCEYFSYDETSEVCAGCGSDALPLDAGSGYNTYSLVNMKDFPFKLNSGLDMKCPLNHDDQILTTKTSTREQCYNICKDTPECTVFTFAEGDKLWYADKDVCKLCKSGESLESHKGLITYQLSYSPVATDFKCPYDDTRIFKEYTGAFEECYARCYNQPTCEYFTYDENSGYCFGCDSNALPLDSIDARGFKTFRLLDFKQFSYTLKALDKKCPYRGRLLTTSTSTRDECYELCKDTGDCGIFSYGEGDKIWDKEEHLCMLCKSSDSVSSHVGFISYEIKSQADELVLPVTESPTPSPTIAIDLGDYDANCMPNEIEDVPGDIQYIETSADGNHVYGIGIYNEVYYRRGRSGTWSSPLAYKLKQISVSRDASLICGIGIDNKLYHVDGTNLVEIGYPYRYVAVSPDGNHIWGISTENGLYHKDGLDGKWRRRTGELVQISVVEDGGVAWGVDKDGDVYYRPGFNEKWAISTGNFKHISVSADGEHIWATYDNDSVYYRNGSSDHWTPLPTDRAKMISVGGQGKDVWSVNVHNDINYRRAFPGRWRQYMGILNQPNLEQGLRFVSFSGDGQSVFGISKENNHLFRSAGLGEDWNRIDGEFSCITVNEDASEMWAVNDENEIFRRRVSESTEFTKIMGTYRQVAASADGQNIYAINKGNGNVYHRAGWEGNRFKPLPGPVLTMSTLSVSRDGSNVWGVRPNDDVYFRAGKDGIWEKVEGSMKYIAVSPDGEHVWAINNYSELFMRNAEDGKWIKNEVPGPLNQIAVGDNMEVWGVDSDGNTFYLDCNV